MILSSGIAVVEKEGITRRAEKPVKSSAKKRSKAKVGVRKLKKTVKKNYPVPSLSGYKGADAGKTHTQIMRERKAEAEERAEMEKGIDTETQKHAKWKPTSQHMYGLTTTPEDPYRTLPSHKAMDVEQKLTETDQARRTKAHNVWLSGKESGTPRDIYLRLYASDEKRIRASHESK